MNVKQYAAIIASALIAFIYSLFKNKSDKLAALQAQIDTKNVTTEINALTKESENAHVQSQNASNDYNALKLIDGELATKLGIASNQSNTSGNSGND